ncbi:hypothetical protein [Providencia sp. PROV128]|uniref:hypothetical protein n=1 Tax=Providencia sp. PROV128 TaxID=2949838 RepID=UPI0023496B86|nr:hypothetical protein [Providencia sp. PROV128]
MTKSKFIKLEKKIDELKAITENLDIFSVSNRMFHEMIMFAQGFQHTVLNSPARQITFLLGIMVSQKNNGSKELTDDTFTKVSKLLNDIFFNYLDTYLPDESEAANGLTESWFLPRKVSMSAFISYFFENPKITTDEIRKDILETNKNFECEIAKNFGLSHKEMIAITDEIARILQSNIDEIQEIVTKIDETRLEFVNIDISKYDQTLKNIQEKCQPLIQEYTKRTSELSEFKFTDLKNIPSEHIEIFKKNYSITKGEGHDIKYITDENILDKKPIITTGDNRYTLSFINQILFAIQNNIEDFFKSDNKLSEKYRKSRDKKLETDTKKAFQEILPANSLVIESVFENNKSSHEHDLLIKVDRTILIIEAKAAPRREPLTDPYRAFTRIKDDFKRKSGIQGGCDQALRLKSFIENNETAVLYDKKGNELLTLNKLDYDEIFCICVTKDEFGMLATDLSSLLEKPENSDYPWVVKITDLKFYFSCLKYINKDWEYFMSYLRSRIALMGKIYSSDELEIAGHHLKHGGFGTINEKNSILMLDMSESNVFDEIHIAKLEGKKFNFSKSTVEYSELNRNNIFNGKNKKNKNAKKNNKTQKIARRKNRK